MIECSKDERSIRERRRGYWQGLLRAGEEPIVGR